MDKRMVVLAMAAMLTAGVAAAQGGNGMGDGSLGSSDNMLSPEVFSAIDSNRDGSLSQSELQQHESVIRTLNENFSRADQNTNGSIDESEFAAIEILPEGHPSVPPSKPGMTPGSPPETSPGVM